MNSPVWVLCTVLGLLAATEHATSHDHHQHPPTAINPCMANCTGAPSNPICVKVLGNPNLVTIQSTCTLSRDACPTINPDTVFQPLYFGQCQQGHIPATNCSPADLGCRAPAHNDRVCVHDQLGHPTSQRLCTVMAGNCKVPGSFAMGADC